MIDLHTHTLFSDGELVPSELVRRARVAGYRAIALTDHMDASSIDLIIPRLVKAAGSLNAAQPLTVIPGAELTHVPPRDIPEMVREARSLGARIVVVHGETVVEPVEAGTNAAAIEAGADILAHPGLISPEEMKEAAERGIFMEITSRRGHSLANGHVAALALKAGAPLVINTDAHSPADLIDRRFAETVLRSAGLGDREVAEAFANAERLVKRTGSQK